jgi:competence protein ComEA
MEIETHSPTLVRSHSANWRALELAPLAAHLLFVAAFLGALLYAATLDASPTKKPPLKPLDINLATVTELQQVPGIGRNTAAAIVHLRAKAGPYKRVEDLLAIRGISRKRLEEMRPYLTVNPPARSKPK